MKECTKVVYELMNESSITFNNIDMKIAKKLLWFVSTEAERRERGINHLVSRRVTNRGRTPGLTVVSAGHTIGKTKKKYIFVKFLQF